MIDLEIALARGLGWSLYDLDLTDISSLFPFIRRMNQTAGAEASGTRKTYCDQVSL